MDLSHLWPQILSHNSPQDAPVLPAATGQVMPSSIFFSPTNIRSSNLSLPEVTCAVRAQPAPKTQRLYISKDKSAGVTIAQPFYSLSCGSLQTPGEAEAFQVEAGKKWVWQNKRSQNKDKWLLRTITKGKITFFSLPPPSTFDKETVKVQTFLIFFPNKCQSLGRMNFALKISLTPFS